MKTALCFLPGLLVLAIFWGIMAIIPQPSEKEINWEWSGWIDDPPERASGYPYPIEDHPTRTRPQKSGMGVPPISPAPPSPQALSPSRP